jgi:hypothetical protein
MSETLQQFMDNLYQSGMSIENVIRHGFDFAYRQGYEAANFAQRSSGVLATIQDTVIRFEASKAVLAAANAIEISLQWQMQSSRKKG